MLLLRKPQGQECIFWLTLIQIFHKMGALDLWPILFIQIAYHKRLLKDSK